MTIEEYKKQQTILNNSRDTHLEDMVAKLKDIGNNLKINM